MLSFSSFANDFVTMMKWISGADRISLSLRHVGTARRAIRRDETTRLWRTNSATFSRRVTPRQERECAYSRVSRGTRRWNSDGGCVAGAYCIYTSSEISPNCWRSSVSSLSSISSRLLTTVSFSSFCTILPPFPVTVPPAAGRQSTSCGWSPVVRL